MARTATLHRLRIALSDVDRGVYEPLDLRLAQHPSETARYLYTRALAFALQYEEGLALTRGLSSVDEPALWTRTHDGRVLTWIDVGAPSAERLHKAAKRAERVVVFTYHEPAALVRETVGKPLFRRADLEGYALDGAFLDSLAAHTSRNASWELVRTGDALFVSIDGHTLEGQLGRFHYAL